MSGSWGHEEGTKPNTDPLLPGSEGSALDVPGTKVGHIRSWIDAGGGGKALVELFMPLNE